MGATLLYENKILEEKVSDDVATTRGSLTIKVAAMSNDADNGCLGVSGAVQFEHNGEQRGNTLCDLHHQENYGDDEYDEEDDSDWEPVNHLVFKKWFCSNCTMPNFDDVYHCDVCGEQKESEIFSHELFKHSFGDGNWNSINTESLQMFQGTSCKSSTAVGFDERMLLHCEAVMKSHPHPERPDRLKAIAASLAAAGIFPGKCTLIPAREIQLEELQKVHSSDHIEAVQQSSCLLSSYFTPDTYANQHSALAARLAAGLCADLAIFIMSGKTSNGFALVRPPGHHAGIRQAMGFCLHNNAAVAALAAQTAGANKVLIVDWDVHHGNGTQEIFDGNKSVLYVSLHRHENGRFYPGTGAANEVGVMDGKGYSVNIPWSRGGVGDNDYIFAFQHIVLPVASEFAPDITIISAGFDAARGDPLGGCDVTPAGYAMMTHMLSSLSQGKLLVILEGGYNLRSISSSATAVIKVLLGEIPRYDMSDVKPSKAGLETVLQVLKIQMKFWPILGTKFEALRAEWKLVASNRRKFGKRRRFFLGPIWWRWGAKRFVYELLYGHRKMRRHSKRFLL
ncbi:histone deacetylase 15 [Dendrobium catenatum]|uniref:histone deacetylase n=1 Tax=Dendrobium catenatum TaxID=906689 RepID=A0A2I0VLY2_9ASPA|nr:histone deacetylase 15 [Dendrobium catenatum]PKU64419.1 Histone deacetylase 15 [Dendrobium catenatum]